MKNCLVSHCCTPHNQKPDDGQATGRSSAGCVSASHLFCACVTQDLDKCSIFGNDVNDLGVAMQWLNKTEDAVAGLYGILVNPSLPSAYESIRKMWVFRGMSRAFALKGSCGATRRRKGLGRAPRYSLIEKQQEPRSPSMLRKHFSLMILKILGLHAILES